MLSTTWIDFALSPIMAPKLSRKTLVDSIRSIISNSGVGWLVLSMTRTKSNRISFQKRIMCCCSHMQPRAVMWRRARQALTLMSFSWPFVGLVWKRGMMMMSAVSWARGTSVSLMKGPIAVVLSSSASVSMSMSRYIGVY